MTLGHPPLPAIDERNFRDVIGHFASGVTVITTSEGDQLYGTTVSAFSSLALDPPMTLVCLNRTSSTHDALIRTGRFAANVLSSRQGELAVRFARPLDDRFAGLVIESGPAGLPLLGERLAGIECEVVERHVGGTHTVFFGRVLSAAAQAGDPLTYYRGQFGEFHGIRERHAFTDARRWILQRAVPVGGGIDLERMASDLGIATTTVYNTLVRLTATGLVRKETDGSFRVAPLTAEAVDELYRTRYAIESGVIDGYLRAAGDGELSRLVTQADALTRMPLDTGENLEAFLDRNLEFHAEVVALSGSRELVERFRECSVAAAWRATYDQRLWRQHLGHGLLTAYVSALQARDVALAQRLLREQSEFVRQAARDTVETRGGEL